MDNQTTSKKDFIFGLVSGIAILAVIGLVVMAGMYFNQKKNLLAALPLEDGITGAGDNTQPPSSPPSPTQPAQVEVSPGENIRGSLDGIVTIVEFSDFQCPFCFRFHPTLQQILRDYPTQVAWAYRHFPLDSIHSQARPAAEASECAAEQNKFWEFADRLFENQSKLGESFYSELASQLGLNTAQFDDCVSSGKYRGKVEAVYQAGIEVGVRGTPASFINGQLLSGAVPYEQVKALVEQALSGS